MMNIIQAIKSGKLFRRAGWADDGIWVNHPQEDDIAFTSGFEEQEFVVELTVQDIQAEDWIVK